MNRRIAVVIICAIFAIPVTAAAQCTATYCFYLPIGIQGTWPTPSPDPSPTAPPSVPPKATPTAMPTATPAPSATPSPSTAPVGNTITWSTAASYKESTSEAQSAVVGGKLYVFGGFDGTKSCCTPTDRSYVFDPTAGSQGAWTSIAPLPYKAGNGATGGGVTHAPMTTDGTDIFMAGGYIASAPGSGQKFGTKQVWRYNVASNSYTQLADLPSQNRPNDNGNRAAGQIVYLNDQLHYIAGTNEARTVDVGDHYVLPRANTATGWATSWITKAALPNPRQHAAAVALNGKIYYIGGQWKHDGALVPQNDVHVYDPARDEWNQVADMPRPINHASSSTFVMNDRIIVVAGQMNAGKAVNNVSAYDPATDSWSEMTPLPVSKHSGVAGVIGNTIYFTTGEGDSRSKTHKGVVSSTPTMTQADADGWSWSAMLASILGE